MEQFIEVYGTGEVRQVPDSVEILFTLTAEDKEYAAVAERNAAAQTKIKAALMRAGLKAKELKTSHFSVDTVYDSVRGDRGETERVFRGYRCEAHLSVRFPFGNKRLGKALGELANGGAPCEYRLRFFVADAAAAGEEALRLAVADARRKAELLADAAGLKLLATVEIDYAGAGNSSYSETEFRPVARAMSLSAVPDFVPTDVGITERVKVRYKVS